MIRGSSTVGRTLVLSALALGLVACGSDKKSSSGSAASGGSAGTGGSGAGGSGGAFVEATSTLLYGKIGESDAELLPSDRYTKADSSTETGLRVNLSSETVAAGSQLFTYGSTLDQLNELDGFSTVGGITLKFSEPIDVSGLAFDENADEPSTGPYLDAAEYTRAGAPMMLMDVDPSSPDVGEAIGIVPVYFSQKADSFWLFDDHTLIVQPAKALRPGTRYCLVITDALKAQDGTAVGRSEHMHDVLTDAYSDDYTSGLLADVEQVLAKLGVERDQVIGATSFTTASATTTLAKAAEARRAAPAPTVTQSWEVERESPEQVRFVNYYPSPEYRQAPPNGKFDVDEAGVPKVQQDVDLELYLAFSQRDVSGPRPVVIYGHGLGGDKDGEWGTAGRLDAIHDNGVAVFSIDSPEHGYRTDGETTLISSAFGFFGIDKDTNDFDIGRARDNFRQMALDQLELVRLIKNLESLDVLPVGAPDGVPDLDTSKILYIGHSFGSVQGATIAALAPEIEHATWNVGGGNMMMLLRDSNTFSLVVEGLAPSGTPFGAIASFMAYTQAIVDPGDSVNYARYVTQEALPGVPNWKARDVLIQEVVPDGIVPNSTSEILARSAGLDLLHSVSGISGLEPLSGGPVSANLPSGATGVITQFDKVTEDNGMLQQVDHGSLIFAPEGIAQYEEFFRTGLETGRGTVIDPYAQ